MALIPYSDSATRSRGRESDGTPAVRPAPAGGKVAVQVPGLPAPGREAPVARPLAARPDGRAPDPGPGRRRGRAVGRDRSGRPAPVERPRPRRGGRPAEGQRGRPEADAP